MTEIFVNHTHEEEDVARGVQEFLRGPKTGAPSEEIAF